VFLFRRYLRKHWWYSWSISLICFRCSLFLFNCCSTVVQAVVQAVVQLSCCSTVVQTVLQLLFKLLFNCCSAVAKLLFNCYSTVEPLFLICCLSYSVGFFGSLLGLMKWKATHYASWFKPSKTLETGLWESIQLFLVSHFHLRLPWAHSRYYIFSSLITSPASRASCTFVISAAASYPRSILTLSPPLLLPPLSTPRFIIAISATSISNPLISRFCNLSKAHNLGLSVADPEGARRKSRHGPHPVWL